MHPCLQLVEVWIFFYFSDSFPPRPLWQLKPDRRRHHLYSSWDDPIQRTTLKEMLPSWSADRHQSWKIGQRCLSTGVWVYIENNGRSCFDVLQMPHSLSKKYCFGTGCDLLSFTNDESFFFLLETSCFRTRFSLWDARLNSSRCDCKLSVFLSEEGCPHWLLDGLVALLHTICATIIKWLAEASMWNFGTLEPGFRLLLY